MTYVFDWNEPRTGDDRSALLGGKGAGLNVMAVELGIPVPPAFTICTDACNAFLASGWPAGLDDEIREHMAHLEAAVGRRFGDPSDPLLVSVRSGAPVSMPGMMDTILNLGLNEATGEGLARVSGDEGFAADCRRRFGEMYREIVGAAEVPDDPWLQLRAAIEAVFRSWNSERARTYRAREGIADDLGTGVTVQAMVFGNRDERSGSGVLFTRDPATGRHVHYGDVMFRAQGEDVVAGTHETFTLDELATRLPDVAEELHAYADALERHHGDMCDIEFTIESGKLWLLQSRIGKRSPQAALRIAIDMAEADDVPLTRRQAVERIAHLLADPPRASAPAQVDAEPMTTGHPASPGMASGEIATSADAAVAVADAGRSVVLVRSETSPDDVHGMSRAAALLTAKGGLASHAAVVARGWGIPAVVGASEVNLEADGVRIGSRLLASGTPITVDGSSGNVYEGALSGSSAVSPEAETLLAWARELGVEIPGGQAAPSDGEVDGDALLNLLAIKGYAMPDAAAEALFAAPDATRVALDELVEAGLAEAAAGSYRPTAAGREAATKAQAAARQRWGSERANEALDSFLELDHRVKEVVTAWQVKTADGAETPNDHADEAYDAGVLERLRALHEDAVAWLAPHAAEEPGFQRYRQRLDRATRLAIEGDGRYVASPRVDSYHSVWFELHEELIQMAGRTREDEVAAGRA